MYLIVNNPSEALKVDGVRAEDRAALWAMAHRLADAPQSNAARLALHCTDILVAVAAVVDTKRDGSVALGDVISKFDHIDHHHIEAAVYLLAHCFEPTEVGPSPSIKWATKLVDSLLDQAG